MHCFLRFGLLIAFFCGSLAEGMENTGNEEYWIIDRVQVENKGADAVSAREKALQEGQRQAFLGLLNQLPIANSAKEKLTNTKGAEILGLIFDFSVQDERVAPGKYRALLRYRFPKEAVGRWLESKHIVLQEEALDKIITKETKSTSLPSDSPLDKAFADAFGPEVVSSPSVHRKESPTLEALKKDVYVEIPIAHFSDWFLIKNRLEPFQKMYSLYMYSQNWVILQVSSAFLNAHEYLKEQGMVLEPVETIWRLSCKEIT
ncbi:MAG: hypothetical protein LBH38_01060 [Holosporales bacterium]|jgi:hypothetical protein|nr:hypothetical protein [Holosporales bacterium]